MLFRFSSCKYKNLTEYVEIKDKDFTGINISLLTRDILLEAKRITELYEEHGQIFVNDGQILTCTIIKALLV